MEKKTNKYHLALKLKQYANGETLPARELEFDFDNHDEIFSIIERIEAKNPFNDPSQAVQFALGLKLFAEVKLKNRNHPLFEELNTVFGDFMKKLKSL
ncbi:protein of unknown function [Pedobacter westerhofensis]|uniref:DUF3861 domain-containing protein n=1 Tax=Pedobacter westerhofensis TaxID=425512 RepID=A0A521FDL5_9SPHI|nr:DUF3861 domain-containing protein [Pedobacter westerhofensis]SMO94298.1 protein of unknown function [Pedobacter westerhofensis]